MSKYVRLKDGSICDDGDKYRIDEEGNYCEIETFMARSEEVIMIPKENIAKESDNLEDLFDAVIKYGIKDNDRIVAFRDEYFTDHEFYEHLSVWKNKVLNDLSGYIELYASNWVEDDLMKVAKLNKDGEWELM